jgi:hypothetical protein
MTKNIELSKSPKIQKIQKVFVCETCNYKCCKNSEYTKHLSTAKHHRLTNPKEILGNTKKIKQKISKVYLCDCGKDYKHQSSLCKHKKTCNATMEIKNTIVKQDTENLENPDNNSKESIILALIAQNKELMNLLTTQQHEHSKTVQEQSKTMQEQTKTLQKTMQEQTKTIQEMVPKIGNNNTTNNNKFNLHVFLNEECKDAINFSEFIENIEVTEEDLENQAQLGYVSGISKLFLENLKELGTTKRPIHCTDNKRNTLYIKEDNEWDKEGSLDQMKQGIFKVQCKTFQRLCAIKDENQEEYSDMDSDFSVKCLNIQRNLTPGSQRETTIGKIVNNISTNSTIEREP